jgi:hypothetical protein
MADYGDLAQSLFQKYLPKFGSFGRYVNYRVMPTAAYDPADGSVDAAPTMEFVVYGLLMTFGSITGAGKTRQIDDRVPLNIDREFIVAAADMPVEPNIGDQILADGKLWRVLAINPDPKPATYSMHVRPWGAPI